jgi:hypothetical protein
MEPDSTSKWTWEDIDKLTIADEGARAVCLSLRFVYDELQLLRAAVELQQPGVDSFDLVGNDHGGKLPG